jgi:hypothetical protein
MVEVVDAGARLRVRNQTGREVMVLGYAGEPYLRVGPAGVPESELGAADGALAGVHIAATKLAAAAI